MVKSANFDFSHTYTINHLHVMVSNLVVYIIMRFFFFPFLLTFAIRFLSFCYTILFVSFLDFQFRLSGAKRVSKRMWCKKTSSQCQIQLAPNLIFVMEILGEARRILSLASRVWRQDTLQTAHIASQEISSPPKICVQSSRAFICFTSHWMKSIYAYGYLQTQNNSNS